MVESVSECPRGRPFGPCGTATLAWADRRVSVLGFVEGLDGEHLLEPGDLEQSTCHRRRRVDHELSPFGAQVLVLRHEYGEPSRIDERELLDVEHEITFERLVDLDERPHQEWSGGAVQLPGENPVRVLLQMTHQNLQWRVPQELACQGGWVGGYLVRDHRELTLQG